MPMHDADTSSGERRPLRVWLITIGEPLPTDPGGPRLLRTGIVAARMHARGHEVTWWTSNFDHQRKLVRSTTPRSGSAPDGYRLELLAGHGYRSNVSLARIRNHREVARDFRSRAPHEPVPDIILCSYPTIELCEAALEYGRSRQVPVVLDLRDIWPDSFLNLLPAALRPLGRLPLRGMFDASRRVLRDADSIIGITEGLVQWALDRAGRPRRESDASFPLAYESRLPAPADLERANKMWDSLGVSKASFTLCFFGTLGRQFDIGTVLSAARRLSGGQVRFVICGDGDRLARYRRDAADLDNVLLPGWVDAASIRALMDRSAAGLAPYFCVTDFKLSIPNKAIEYLAGGLPVVSCLTGELQRLLDETGSGVTWTEGDPSSLVEAIEALRLAPDRQRRMADNAARAYRARFVADVVYERLIDHLAEVASRHTSALKAAH